MKRRIRIGLIGYGFMGRTHSNAYSQLSHFFNTEHLPVRQAVCGTNEEKVKAFAEQGEVPEPAALLGSFDLLILPAANSSSKFKL